MITIFSILAARAMAIEPEINVSQVERDVRYLASVELEGRMTGSAGLAKAADFAVERFKSLGLKPLEGDSYLWGYNLTIGQRATARNIFSLSVDRTRTTFALGDDFVPMMNSRSGGMATGSLAYVGYGIQRDDRKDLDGVDLKGRIVIVLRGTPAGLRPTTDAAKGIELQRRGAVGAIFIGPASPGGSELPKLTRPFALDRDNQLVAVGARTRILKELTGLDYAKETTKPSAPRQIKATVRLITETEPNQITAHNVIAVLPGNDPKLKAETIIVGGHYDHLGYGESSSMSGSDHIHFGADDNASGSAGVLAVAEAFAKSRANARTMIFQLYSGEELGLLGSEAWANAHPEILATTQAMVNMDMIGRLRNGKLIAFGTGSAKEFDAIVDAVKVEGVVLAKNPTSPPNSDHASFNRRRVPALFFNTDLHSEYHTERDTADTIAYDGMGKVLSFVIQTLKGIDAISARIGFTGDTQGVGPQKSGSTRRIRIGFIPDMSDSGGRGLLINGASPDSPAAKAGVKAGDLLIELGGTRVRGIEDLQEAMSKLEAGVATKMIVIRDGREVELMVTPTAAVGG